ncbi:hypothetical protein C8A03DRAFT_35227 [Achaetomium macrosporum]|uniref:VWFA domain-containing protein n=1 Tax=Achaetomium macrosporum TaxID=79813 RepID=A0AAN7C9H7_9PEZI|nr:hypothetical protein C8A03DRAFT_35227 [Achaetomium macrosporum]
MSSTSPAAVVGCLLDVSDSMREALEAGRSDERAIERLRAVLRAALKLAQAEQRHDPNALVFVGVFGLDTNNGCPPVADLCGAADALLGNPGNHGSGHNLLIARADKENVSHITKYIREKLTNDEARIVDAHLERYPERVKEFVDAIPPEQTVENAKTASRGFGVITGAAVGAALAAGVATGGVLLGAASVAASAIGGGAVGNKVADKIEDNAVERSEAMHLARRICAEWLQNFTTLVPRPVDDVIRLLKQLQKRSEVDESSKNGNTGDSTLLDTLRRYMYGCTPMRDALSRSLMVFNEHLGAEHRVLVLVSDGLSTDGDPLPLALDLQQAKVSMATVYLTSNKTEAPRRLYYQPADSWDPGQRILFGMAARVAGVTHPIPVLTSVGWEVPSAGEVALHATVSSSAALDEFCSLLLSARFGSADALLDVIGRISHDSYINDEHILRCKDPSDQGQSATCYAHATAAVVHMALLRIVGREDGYPSIEEVRKRIEDEFPSKPGGRSTVEVLTAATTWYPPLRFRMVDEDGARQAVLRRRPVLTTFHLSKSGWDVFAEHFRERSSPPEEPLPALRRAQMAAHRSLPSDGGHAVVLTTCNPDSLTFLNSWGNKWGNKGSFSVEDHTVLELDGTSGKYPVNFYDVYWLESELTVTERQAYNAKVDEELRCRAAQYPSILELEARCPHCHDNAPLANFRGSIRQVQCPHPQCNQYFTPQPGHLMKALYAREGISDV